jgi:hypothetical protein
MLQALESPHVLSPQIVPFHPRREQRLVKLSWIALRTGFGKHKLIDDIAAGYLVATQDPRSGVWLVTCAEAQRYLRSLGILD